MKTPRSLSKLLVASTFAATSVFAQDAVTSDVVGYVSKTLPSGASLAAFPLHNAPQFSGAINADGVSGAVLTVDGLPSSISLVMFKLPAVVLQDQYLLFLQVMLQL